MTPVMTCSFGRSERPRREAPFARAGPSGDPRRDEGLVDVGTRLDGALSDDGTRLDGALSDDGARLDGAAATEGGGASEGRAEGAAPSGADGGLVRRFGGLRSGLERLIRRTSWHRMQRAGSHA